MGLFWELIQDTDRDGRVPLELSRQAYPRAEQTRMSTSPRLFLLALLALLALLLAPAAVAQTAAGAPPIPPPGRLVDLGGWRLHLRCSGERRADQPVVILEAGAGGFSVDWSLVQPEAARSARLCSYDRAGLGWSELGPPPLPLEPAGDRGALGTRDPRGAAGARGEGDR